MQRLTGVGLLENMHRGLGRKYEISLNFYKEKEINQILSMDTRYDVYLDFCDARLISEEFQYLKRVYYYRTHSGKPEIPQRMKLISEHYATNPSLSTFTYEYPMMVITNTKSLFLKRKRRLRKIGVGECSSDDTEQQQQQFPELQYPTQYFLEELEHSSLTEKSQPESQISYETQPEDIYYDENMEMDEEINEEQILRIDEEDIKELIDDFTHESFPSKRNSVYEGTATTLPLNAFKNIENRERAYLDSVEITPIQDKPRIEKKQKRSSIFSGLADMLLSKPISFSDLGLRLNNPILDEYGSLPMVSEPQSIDREREERASKRKRIREKAEQLLKRVRNEEQGSRPL